MRNDLKDLENLAPRFLGWEVDLETGELIGAPCGCPCCDDRVTEGHFLCSPSPDELLEEELHGSVFREFLGNRWVWVVEI